MPSAGTCGNNLPQSFLSCFLPLATLSSECRYARKGKQRYTNLPSSFPRKLIWFTSALQAHGNKGSSRISLFLFPRQQTPGRSLTASPNGPAQVPVRSPVPITILTIAGSSGKQAQFQSRDQAADTAWPWPWRRSKLSQLYARHEGRPGPRMLRLQQRCHRCLAKHPMQTCFQGRQDCPTRTRALRGLPESPDLSR